MNGTATIPIPAREGDDPGFLDCARRCIAGAVRSGRFDEVYTLRIDNWFGAKWLGFSGVTAVPFDSGLDRFQTRLKEVRRDPLTLPPFTRKRVRERRRYVWNGYAGDFVPDVLQGGLLGPGRTAHESVLRLGDAVALFWFSGNTAVNGVGSLMMYSSVRETSGAWYASFANSGGWCINRAAGIPRERVRELEELGARMEARTRSQLPSEEVLFVRQLHAAVDRGELAAVSELLARDVQIEGRDWWGRTPLLRALSAGEWDCFRLLLSAGANPFQQDYSGLDGLHHAVNAAEAEGQTRDAVRAARELLERGVSPERRDYDGWTPLALASIRGVRELAELVLDWGAEPCSADRLGYTPLHHASFHGHAPIVELLIGRGGRVSARSRVRSTPLLLAAARGRNRVIELLHAAGASVTVRNRRGWTPLSLARRQGHGGTVELLTRLGARE